MQYSKQNRVVTFKIVYYGPALSGKTTNLIQLHESLNPEMKGELMSLDTKNDRTLFFDLLPIGFKTPSGLLIKLKLYTVPGQVVHDSTRKAVLSRADGVVFVADSQRSQGINNSESFDNLIKNVMRVGLDVDTLPLVIQFNKRDLPDLIPESEIINKWSVTPWDVIFSSALNGSGCIETFEKILRGVYLKSDQELHLKDEHSCDMHYFLENTVNFVEANA